jgi:hypothetical protein
MGGRDKDIETYIETARELGKRIGPAYESGPYQSVFETDQTLVKVSAKCKPQPALCSG